MGGGSKFIRSVNWPYLLYFCILYNKNCIKGLWGHKGGPLLGLGPALVLQWTLHGPTIHSKWPFIEYCHFLNFYRLYICFQTKD